MIVTTARSGITSGQRRSGFGFVGRLDRIQESRGPRLGTASSRRRHLKRQTIEGASAPWRPARGGSFRAIEWARY
jgi:hypothetical protein